MESGSGRRGGVILSLVLMVGFINWAASQSDVPCNDFDADVETRLELCVGATPSDAHLEACCRQVSGYLMQHSNNNCGVCDIRGCENYCYIYDNEFTDSLEKSDAVDVPADPVIP